MCLVHVLHGFIQTENREGIAAQVLSILRLLQTLWRMYRMTQMQYCKSVQRFAVGITVIIEWKKPSIRRLAYGLTR